MKSLIIPTTTLPMLMLKISLAIATQNVLVENEDKVNPVENEELFDHLFVHDDRRFSRPATSF